MGDAPQIVTFRYPDRTGKYFDIDLEYRPNKTVASYLNEIDPDLLPMRLANRLSIYAEPGKRRYRLNYPVPANTMIVCARR